MSRYIITIDSWTKISDGPKVTQIGWNSTNQRWVQKDWANAGLFLSCRFIWKFDPQVWSRFWSNKWENKKYPHWWVKATKEPQFSKLLVWTWFKMTQILWTISKLLPVRGPLLVVGGSSEGSGFENISLHLNSAALPTEQSSHHQLYVKFTSASLQKIAIAIKMANTMITPSPWKRHCRVKEAELKWIVTSPGARSGARGRTCGAYHNILPQNNIFHVIFQRPAHIS